MPPRWPRLILQRLASCLFIVASLMAFPAGLPILIAAWLLLFAVLVVRKKPAWRPPLFCIVILLVKQADWTAELVVLMALMGAAAAWDRWRGPWIRSHAAAVLGLLMAGWGVLAWQWEAAARTDRRAPVDPSRPVVCIGDSLMAGGFPRDLGQRLRVAVVDHAQGGITAAEGLRRFPEALAMNPQAVVIELGGHDYLKGRSRAETKGRLAKMIVDARAIGAEVVLFEVPRGFVFDAYRGLERELAREHDLELIEDGAIRQLVFFSPFTPLGSWTGRSLSDDGLHPNAAGHAWLADKTAAALRRIYGEAILKR